MSGKAVGDESKLSNIYCLVDKTMTMCENYTKYDLVLDTLNTNTTLNITNPMKVRNIKCKLKH